MCAHNEPWALERIGDLAAARTRRFLGNAESTHVCLKSGLMKDIGAAQIAPGAWA